MGRSNARLILAEALAGSLLCFAQPNAANAQPASAAKKVYRGSVGNSHIQMNLNIQGNNVSGTYFYDGIGEDLKLVGHIDQQGRLELAESANGKPTGKFTCKRKLGDEIGSECSWSKPDGTRESYVTLEEQHIAFTNGLQVVPKTIANRRSGVRVSYPQLTSDASPLSPGAASFNRRVLAMTQKAIKEFEPGSEPGRNSFETNYNVLLATDDLISVEMTEYCDSGGAHPNDRFWSMTYDLSANRELRFEDLFKPGSDYNAAIASYVVADIDKRMIAIEQEDARSEGRKPNQRDEPLISAEQLSELSGWGMTPKGLVVYFDFAHVMAAFDKTSIPYGVVNEYLKPNGPVARIHKL